MYESITERIECPICNGTYVKPVKDDLRIKNHMCPACRFLQVEEEIVVNEIFETNNDYVVNDFYSEIENMAIDMAINNMFNYLNEREVSIIRLRFGLYDDGEDLTLDKIAKLLNINRERVRLTESSAIKKLKHHKVNTDAVRMLNDMKFMVDISEDLYSSIFPVLLQPKNECEELVKTLPLTKCCDNRYVKVLILNDNHFLPKYRRKCSTK